MSCYMDLDIQMFREETIVKMIEVVEGMPADGTGGLHPAQSRGGIGPPELLRWAPYLGEEPWLHPEDQAYGFSDTKYFSF